MRHEAYDTTPSTYVQVGCCTRESTRGVLEFTTMSLSPVALYSHYGRRERGGGNGSLSLLTLPPPQAVSPFARPSPPSPGPPYEHTFRTLESRSTE